MARSGAERQKAYLQRQREEQQQQRQRMLDLEGELATAQATPLALTHRIEELEHAQSETFRLSKTTTAQEVVDRLAGEVSDIKLAQVWVLLGERLKAATSRGRRTAEPPERRRERRLVKHLWPSPRRP